MPKLAENRIEWSGETNTYVAHEGGTVRPVVDDGLLLWLERHSSFAFLGHEGRINLLKEARKGGVGYWYAYRRLGKKVAKKYAGRSGEITPARLEEVTRALINGEENPAFVPQTAGRVTESTNASNNEISSTQEPLLTPKLQPPRLQSSLVNRERLIRMLDAGREGKLTIVNAPAGSGKTTLVRQWLARIAREQNKPAVAWVTLDRGDSDPIRFWRYVISACREFRAEVGAQSLALLEAPLSLKSPLDMSLATFVNELARLTQDVVLVLEDYHTIETPQVHETVGFLLEHLPPHAHLLIITRTTPPLPLARLRAAGELTEIEAPELRFSRDETDTFLKQSIALTLPPGELAQFESRIEGWAAGLRLLAIALAGRQDAGEIKIVLENFIAGRRGINEYFVSEVFNSQPSAIQRFLLETSFLGSFTASLCDSVTGRSNSQATLEMLEQGNLFVQPLDEEGLWYRYHALFGAAMQAEARRRLSKEAVREILERAGRWYEEHLMTSEAIEAAFAGDNLECAADLIETLVGHNMTFSRPELPRLPEFYTMQRWLTQLPKTMMDARPKLNFTMAMALLFSYMVDMEPPASIAGSEIERLLDKAEKGFQAAGQSDLLGQVFALRALIIRERGDVEGGVRWAEAALEQLSEHELGWRNICLSTIGGGEQVAGHMSKAIELFAQARALCDTPDLRPLYRACGGMMGGAYVEQNELSRAGAIFRDMLAEARAFGDLDDVAHALQGLAQIALCRNELDTAWEYASEVVEVTQQHPHESYHIYSVLIQARVEQARGETESAMARCVAIQAKLEPAIMLMEKQFSAQIEYEQALISVRAGDLNAAQRWRSIRPTDVRMGRIEQDREVALLARLSMSEGDINAAIGMLEPLIEAARAEGRGRVALEMNVLLSLAYVAGGRTQEAQNTIADALEAAQPENALRVFVDEGETAGIVIRSALPQLKSKSVSAFARSVLRAIGSGSDVSTTTDELSEQERRVLRLLAAGRSNLEIAGELIISVNTVKAHVKSIYRKLNVSSRLEAASAARERAIT